MAEERLRTLLGELQVSSSIVNGQEEGDMERLMDAFEKMGEGKERVMMRGVVASFFSDDIRPYAQHCPFSMPREYSPHTDLRHNGGVLETIRWMEQKNQLEQDLFLVGNAGPTKRWIVFRWLELLRRPCHYLCLSRDSTPADLKQRKELVDGSVVFVDSAVIKAALSGAVLLLEGLESCERNVLPVLNNLLENRELQLDDGRLLIHHKRYKELKLQYSKEQLDRMRIFEILPSFRVVALGLNSSRVHCIDPPLRSRFQFRDLNADLLSASDLFAIIVRHHQHTSPSTAFPRSHLFQKLVHLAQALNQSEHLEEDADDDSHDAAFPLENEEDKRPGMYRAKVQKVSQFAAREQQSQIDRELMTLIPSFPFDTIISRLLRLMILFPSLFEGGDIEVATSLILSHYPLHLMGDPTHIQALDTALRITFDRPLSSLASQNTIRIDFQSTIEDRCPVISSPSTGSASFRDFSSSWEQERQSKKYVMITTHQNLLAKLLFDRQLKLDVCIVGASGSGKSTLVKMFSDLIGLSLSHITTVHLYKDMTVRDLLQRRVIDADGNTAWKASVLVEAAIRGETVILDGLHRLDPSVVAVLQSLCQDRELDLLDGTRLMRWDRFDRLLKEVGADEIRKRKVNRVHPDFHIISLADFPSPQNAWLTQTLSSMFLMHSIPPYNKLEVHQLLRFKCPRLSEDLLELLLNLYSSLMEEGTKNTADIVTRPFSIKHLIRLAKRVHSFPRDLTRRYLFNFLSLVTSLPKTRLHSLCDEMGLADEPSISEAVPKAIAYHRETNQIQIGDVSVAVSTTERPELVPKINFFEMTSHLALLEDMLKDIVIEQHTLLIGPQGVGKNVLIDRLLQELNVEKEYIQLHRDITVQHLTVTPSIEGGQLVWEDSALVRAVQFGRCLVIDEADKAPLEVICVLRGLVDDGEMLLSDGRKIMASSERESIVEDEGYGSNERRQEIIWMDPRFRVVVLANKQGYPFLGNDVLSSLADSFSCHFVDNPSVDAEVDLLRFYGPSVPEELLRKLCGVFGDLRRLVDEAVVSYPYSTRELIHIVKHLEKYPEDGIVQTIRNVFSFDLNDPQLVDQLAQVFLRHGIPFPPKSVYHVRLSPSRSIIRDFRLAAKWTSSLPTLSSSVLVEGSSAEQGLFKAKGGWRVPEEISSRKFNTAQHKQHRINRFREDVYSWTLSRSSDLQEGTDLVGSICCLDDGSIVAVCLQPISLVHYFGIEHRSYNTFDLAAHLRFNGIPNSGSGRFPFRTHLIVVGPSRIVLYVPLFDFVMVLDLQSYNVSVIDLALFSEPSRLSRADGLPPIVPEPLFAMFNQIIYLGYRKRDSLSSRHIECRNDIKPITDLSRSHGIILLISHEMNVVYIWDCQSSGLLSFRSVSLVPRSADFDRVFPAVSAAVVSPTTWIIEGASETFCKLKITFHHESGNEKMSLMEGSVSYDLVQDSSPVALSLRQTGRTVLDGRLVQLLAKQDENQFPSTFTSLHPSSLLVLDQLRGQVGLVPSDPSLTNFFQFETAMTTSRPSSSSSSSIENAVAGEEHEEISIIESVVMHCGREDVMVALVQGKISQRKKMVVINVMNDQEDIRITDVDLRKIRVNSKRPLHLTPMAAGNSVLIASVDGWFAIVEVAQMSIASSLAKWQQMVGVGSSDPNNPSNQRLTLPWNETKQPTKPWAGKGPDGKEHHGGNQFQGGTAGADTPGRGGVGGAFREDGGFDLFEAVNKAEVSEEVKQTQMRMRQEMLLQKMKELGMSGVDMDLFDRYQLSVRLQVNQFQSILRAMQSKSKERMWVRNRDYGELDESRIVDGITGDKNIFKRREQTSPLIQSFQQKLPKRVLFVMDISASMFRFNSQDQRLDRLVEALCMIVMALKGFESKISYGVIGHSGSSAVIPLIDFDHPPHSPAEILKVVKQMQLHSEYCNSGDNTVASLQQALQIVRAKPADEYFVIAVSDANLSRNDIRPDDLRAVFQRYESTSQGQSHDQSGGESQATQAVQCFLIFIASLQNEAHKLQNLLPRDKSFVCFDSADLPMVFKRILVDNLLQQASSRL